MNLYRLLRERGRAASDHYAGSPDYFRLTPASLTLLRGLQPLVAAHCRGRVLDAGAGRGVYRELLQRHGKDYVGMDIAGGAATAVTGDIQRLPFADASFDTVFCSQVLEHVPEPWLALAEFRRVLRAGGCLILTVPHLSWLHNEPHDYYRFTAHGLRFLLGKAGLTELATLPAGGLFSLWGHILATVGVNLAFGVPLLRPLALAVNRFLVEGMALLDRLPSGKRVFPLNYLCIAVKDDPRGESPGS